MNKKAFITNLYDLISKNDHYKPREKLDAILAEMEDWWVDCEDNAPAIFFRDNHGKEYKLILIEEGGS